MTLLDKSLQLTDVQKAFSAGSASAQAAFQSSVSGYNPALYPTGTILSDIAAQAVYSPDFVFAVASDSTGNENDEKIRRLADYIAAQFQSAYVDYRLMNPSTDLYDAPVKLSTGGTEPSVTVGADLRGWAYPAALVGQASDLDFRVTLTPVSWSSGSIQVGGGQYGIAGFRSWYLSINSIGLLNIIWLEADGVTQKSYFSGSAPGFAAGARGSIRVTVDVDNGASGHSVAFYKSSDDGATWTQIGTTQTTAGVSSIYQLADQNYELGSRGAPAGRGPAGSVGGASGTVFWSAHFSPTIDGPNRFPANIRDWQGTSGMNGVRSSGMAIRFYNGAYPGQNFAYFLTGARLEKMVPHVVDNGVFICNTSHNEGAGFAGGVFENNFAAFKERLDTRMLKYRGVISTQNPQKSPRSTEQIYAQQRRCTVSIPAVAAQYGWHLSDEYRLAVWASPTSMGADGVHPAAGAGNGREAQGNCLIRACGGAA